MKIFKTEFKVRTYECDLYGHVNNAVYLNYFEAARVEFLETIDDSINKLSDQITLLSLVFRSESDNLELKCEPNDVREILSVVVDKMMEFFPGKRILIYTQKSISPIFVDYEYFSIAFSLIFEVIFTTQKDLNQITIDIREENEKVILDVFNINPKLADTISQYSCLPFHFPGVDLQLIPINKLRLLVACKVLKFQSINVEKYVDESSSNYGVRIQIPIYANSNPSLSK